MGCLRYGLLFFGLSCCVLIGPAKAQSNPVKDCQSADVDSLQNSDVVSTVKICTEALASSGNSPSTIADLLLARGVAFRNAGALDLSLEDLNKSVELAPQSSSHLRMRAWTLREMGKLPDALRDYDRVLKMGREPQGCCRAATY